jgi:RsiW-degrading membrane proteinase PrsW (M82 family)
MNAATTARPPDGAVRRSESLVQPKRAAFWLFAALLAIGTVVVVYRVMPALSIDIGAVSLSLVTWLLYAVPFVVLIWHLDLFDPEPAPFVAAACAWGGIVAVSVSIVANSSTLSIMAKVAGAEFTREWWAAISGPTSEEVLKALGVVVIILVASTQVTTVLDGLVYGAFVGLAFQVSEGMLYTTDAMQSATFSQTPGAVALDMFLLRGLGLGLWSHAVYTAVVGAGIAYFVVARGRSTGRRVAVALAAFALAWVLHFTWNAPWLQPSSRSSLSADDFVIFAMKGVPALALFIAVYALARRRDVRWFRTSLAGEGHLVGADELDTLCSLRRRREAVRAARAAGGPEAAWWCQDLHRAQIRLAIVLGAARADADEAAAARASVEVSRRVFEQSLVSGPA